MRFVPIWMLAILVVDSFAAGGLATAALLPLRSRGLDSASTRLLEDSLHASLVKTSGMRILTMDYTRWKAPEPCDGMECAVRQGGALGVERTVIATAQALVSGVELEAKLVEVGSGQVLSKSRQTMQGNVSLFAPTISKKVVADLVQGARTPSVSATTALPARVPEPEPERQPEPEPGKSRFWVNVGWVAAGTVVIAGCAAAAYLFIDAMPTSKSPSPGSGDGNKPEESDGSVVFTWD